MSAPTVKIMGKVEFQAGSVSQKFRENNAGSPEVKVMSKVGFQAGETSAYGEFELVDTFLSGQNGTSEEASEVA
jgi:hypothetical protein